MTDIITATDAYVSEVKEYALKTLRFQGAGDLAASAIIMKLVERIERDGARIDELWTALSKYTYNQDGEVVEWLTHAQQVAVLDGDRP